MDHPRSGRALALVVLSVAALAALAVMAATASAETTWLCKPGLASNPCLNSEETTVELANGKGLGSASADGGYAWYAGI